MQSHGPTYSRIYAAVRTIPRGRVSTYGRIAEAAHAQGARQVGYALHALGDSAAVPWQRVVNARGAISLPGSAGVTQRLRLEAEGVRFNSRGVIDLKVFGWPARPAAANESRPERRSRGGRRSVR